MMLKIGELGKHTGLTVRALHHYDAIGLLKPSARSDAGYRLYNRHDIARLHQIQALRKFGLSLADIGVYLARPDQPLATVVANIGKRASEWPPLIAQVQSAMDQGIAPAAPPAQALARHWFDLFRSFAGDNPATQQKIRKALTNEPGLTDTGFVTAAMRDYVRAAMMAMTALRPN
jgi:DNA-binding transcriptional MerR regulator